MLIKQVIISWEMQTGAPVNPEYGASSNDDRSSFQIDQQSVMLATRASYFSGANTSGIDTF